MNENKKEKSIEECEQDFKNKVFGALQQRIPEAKRDEDGLLVIPASAIERIRSRRRKSTDNSEVDKKQ